MGLSFNTDTLNKCIDTEKLWIAMNEIDFEGQKLSGRIYKVILTLFLFIAMGYSYYTQQLKDGVYIMVTGFILSFLLCVPAWPFYKRHPNSWLEHKPENKFLKEKKA